MGNIVLSIRGKKNPSPLYIRFYDGKKFDISLRTQILLNPKSFDNKKECLKHSLDNATKTDLRKKIDSIKNIVFEEYSLSYANGSIIDKEWLQDCINKIFSRPKEDNGNVITHLVYYSEFVEWWIKEKSKFYLTKKGTKISDATMRQYRSFLKIFKRFESNRKIKIKDINSFLIYEFVNFMKEEDYASVSIKRHIVRLRFFISRADKNDIKIDRTYNDTVHVSDEDNLLKPYLNFNEIETIYNYNIPIDNPMDDIRDTFIIGLWTGLRATDLHEKLDITNIENDYIKIKTSKTGKGVVIPLHHHIKAILNKRLGNLPRKIHRNEFNKKIKTLCKKCGINNMMEGSLYDGKKKRSVIGEYEKYKLITSHTCRRSFATNLYGLVPNYVIMAVGGWASEKMMLHYIKKTNKEHADVLKDKWNEIFINRIKDEQTN